MIVLDAGVLIAHLDDGNASHAPVEEALLASADQPFACSPLTLAEVLVGPARHAQLKVACAAVDRLGVEAVPLGADAPALLALLRAQVGLKLPDCCVLPAGQDIRAQTVPTSDEALARAATRLALRPK